MKRGSVQPPRGLATEVSGRTDLVKSSKEHVAILRPIGYGTPWLQQERTLRLRNKVYFPNIENAEATRNYEEACRMTEEQAEVEAIETQPESRPPLQPSKVSVSSLNVDDEVNSWCGKCKTFTAHRVKTLQPPKPPKSVCLDCKAVHQVRLTQPGTKKAKSRKETLNIPSWDVLTADAEADLAPKYMVTGNFEYGDFILHKSFGLGCIVEVLSEERIQVSFESGVKQLIQNYRR